MRLKYSHLQLFYTGMIVFLAVAMVLNGFFEPNIYERQTNFFLCLIGIIAMFVFMTQCETAQIRQTLKENNIKLSEFMEKK